MTMIQFSGKRKLSTFKNFEITLASRIFIHSDVCSIKHVNCLPQIYKMPNTMKKNGVRIQVGDRKNDEDVKVNKGEENDKDEKKKQEDNFYMRVYDDAVAKKTAIDNTIIEYVKLTNYQYILPLLIVY